MIVVRSYGEAVWYIEKRGCPSFTSFDHDLAFEHYEGKPTYEKTGYDLAKWLISKDAESGGRFIPNNFYFNVRFMNPVGARDINPLLSDYLERYK